MRQATKGATREARKNATEPTTRALCGDGFLVHSLWLICACTGTPANRCLFWNRCLVKFRRPGSALPEKFLTVTRRSHRTAVLRKHGRSGKLCGLGEPLWQQAIGKMRCAAGDFALGRDSPEWRAGRRTVADTF